MATVTPPAAPPDEAFWVKYSPNQELPLSSLGSIALHVGAVVVMLGLFFVIGTSRDTSMPVETIALGDDGNAGGGGDPNGTAITNIKGQPRVERATADELPPDAPTPTNAMAPLPDVRSDLIDLPTRADSGGGQGAGTGTGTGAGEGAGSSGSIRARRNKRWTLSFSVSNGDDSEYLKQLNALADT